MTVDVRRINPAWFRAVFLVTLAVPFFNYNIIALASAPVGTFKFYLAWVVYTLLVYALMASSVGIKECLAWVGFASALALVTIGTAALFLYVAAVFGFEFKSAAGVPYTQAEWSRDLSQLSLAGRSAEVGRSVSRARRSGRAADRFTCKARLSR